MLIELVDHGRKHCIQMTPGVGMGGLFQTRGMTFIFELAFPDQTGLLNHYPAANVSANYLGTPS